MELRVLRYFLTICETNSITAAAKALNITQPALSRQIQALEEELGNSLFIRKKEGIILTDAGYFFAKRAMELVRLADQTIADFPKKDMNISGHLQIGAGETPTIAHTIQAIKRLREKYPNIQIHFSNAGSRDVQTRWLEEGIIDFALLSVVPLAKGFSNIKLPVQDTWGLLMRKDDPLACKEHITPEDIKGLPLLAGKSDNFRSLMSGWLGYDFQQLNMIGTSFLMTSTEALVSENVAYAIIRQGIMDEGIASPVIFRPFYPEIKSNMYLAWSTGRNLTVIQKLFLNEMKA